MGPRKPSRFIRLSDGAVTDLKLWESFLAHFNGRGLLSFGPPILCSDLNICADASKSGYGATFGRKFIQGLFPPAWARRDIQALELYPLAAILTLFSPQLSGKYILIQSDNLPLVHALNSHTTRCSDVMLLLRPLILTFMRARIKFHAVHVPGVKNILCDKLSRQQATPALLSHYGMDPLPTPLPDHLLPGNLAEW